MKTITLECGCSISYSMHDDNLCLGFTACTKHAEKYQKNIEDIWKKIINGK